MEIRCIHPGKNIKVEQVKILWKMTDWCDYGCPYCIEGGGHHYALEPKETESEMEKSAWRMRPKLNGAKVKLTMLGGEVSLHYDLEKLLWILFDANQCRAEASLVTNFSAPLDVYKKFMAAGDEINGLRTRITPSYHWRNTDEFLEKCRWLTEKTGGQAYATAVVWSGTTAGQLAETLEKFADSGVVLRLVHGRIPKGGGRFYELSDDVRKIVSEHQKTFAKDRYNVVFSDGTRKEVCGKSDLLRMTADLSGKPGADFRGMRCISGLEVRKDGSIVAGACGNRNRTVIGSIHDEESSLKPYDAVCSGESYCNLCSSMLIWDGSPVEEL